jgi:hypothetical protein
MRFCHFTMRLTNLTWGLLRGYNKQRSRALRRPSEVAHSRYSNSIIICGDGTDRMTGGFVTDLCSLVSTAGILAVLVDFATTYADKA